MTAPATTSRRRPLVVRSNEQPSSSSSSFSSEVSSSSSEEGDEEEEGAESQPQQTETKFQVENSHRGTTSSISAASEKAKIAITIKKICKVCKGTGHQAGFVGATYVDCPKKPCFLCKLPGHTTMSCPHRVAMEHGVLPSPRRNTLTSLDYIFERQLRAYATTNMKPTFIIPNQVDRGVVKFHSRRVTCLEFHPTKDGILLSGDKKGQLGIWDYKKLHEKTIYGSIHSCLLNNLKFNMRNDGMVFTSSSDGTLCCTDLETGMPLNVMNLNPDGWSGPASWRMLYGLDVNSEKGILFVGDNFGHLYLVDTRSRNQIGKSILIHKKGTKVVGLHCNPVQPDILLSCGNDHYARIWDTRRLESDSSLGDLAHGRVVNSAYFSPLTGSKILSTCQDNRIRIWDSIFRDLHCPSREIIHSHDFNRHLTPFRAEWDPKDPSESLAAIGRYISENINGIALHPIDFLDTATGQLVAEVTEPEITTISPVIKLHPRENILASGSSRSVFIWSCQEDTDSEDTRKKHQERLRKFVVGNNMKKIKGKFDDESDDDGDGDDFRFKGKKMKSEKLSKFKG